jgi:cytochrome c-type biogenesis protein CcmF
MIHLVSSLPLQWLWPWSAVSGRVCARPRDESPFSCTPRSTIVTNNDTNNNIIEISVKDYLQLSEKKKNLLKGYKTSIDFSAKDKSDSFKLYPDVMKQNKGMEGFSANPSAKHYWFKDIFAYITSFQENNAADTATFRNKVIKVGDTLFYSNGLMMLDKVAVNPIEQKNKLEEGEASLFLNLKVISKEGRIYTANPGIAIKGQNLRFINDTIRAQSLVLQFNKVIDQASGKLEIGVKESGAITDLITLKVYVFPLINMLWLGVIVMVTGFVMAIRQRLLMKSNLKSV